jgi:hypothetical protein
VVVHRGSNGIIGEHEWLDLRHTLVKILASALIWQQSFTGQDSEFEA